MTRIWPCHFRFRPKAVSLGLSPGPRCGSSPRGMRGFKCLFPSPPGPGPLRLTSFAAKTPCFAGPGLLSGRVDTTASHATRRHDSDTDWVPIGTLGTRGGELAATTPDWESLIVGVIIGRSASAIGHLRLHIAAGWAATTCGGIHRNPSVGPQKSFQASENSLAFCFKKARDFSRKWSCHPKGCGGRSGCRVDTGAGCRQIKYSVTYLETSELAPAHGLGAVTGAALAEPFAKSAQRASAAGRETRRDMPVAWSGLSGRTSQDTAGRPPRGVV
jgi:hypothetical protein